MKKTILFIFVSILFFHCYYDATPPSDEKLSQKESFFNLSIDYSVSNTPIALMYWSSNKFEKIGFQKKLTTDYSGAILSVFSLDYDNPMKMSVYGFIDINKNNKLDSTDLAWLNENLSKDNNNFFTSFIDNTHLKTVISKTITAPFNDSTIKRICMFFPSGTISNFVMNSENTFSVADNVNSLVWQINEGATSQKTSFFHPDLSYDSFCFKDTNNDNIFNSKEEYSINSNQI